MSHQPVEGPPQRKVVRRRHPAVAPTQPAPQPASPTQPVATPEPLPTPVPVPLTARAPDPISFPAPVPLDDGSDDDECVDKVDPSSANWFKRVTPDERHDQDDAWLLSDLASACPNPDLDATSRLDPFWDGMWTGNTSTWLSRDLAERKSEAGLLTLPPRLMGDHDESVDKMSRGRSLTKQVTLLGALHSWRTCSTEQLAALTGNTDLLVPVNALTSAGFCSDLIDIAPSPTATTAAKRFGRQMLLRPSASSVFDQTVKPRLTWAEWLAVTGGQDWTSGTQYDRHNLLATELGLRLAEYTDVATVLGERFSTVDLLAGSGIGRPAMPVTDRRSGDLTAVRLDGMRVVIEVTATVSKRFGSKVERWVQLLSDTPMNESGLVVVFLIAALPDKSHAARHVRSRVYNAVVKAVKKNPGTSLDRTAHRIAVATWREWFPAAHKASDAFLSMRVDRPTGKVDGPGRWEQCDLMGFNQMPFEAKNSEALLAVVDNAGGLGQTPYWLRENTNPPTFITDLLAGVGLTDIPRPVSSRPDRVNGRPHGQGIGAAGNWKVPPRLLGLARELHS